MKTKKDRHGRGHDAAGRFAVDPGAPTRAYNDAYLHLLREKTRLLEQQNRDFESRYIPRAEVEAAVRANYLNIWRRVMKIPGAVAARMPGVKTPSEAEHIMRDEIYAALTDISQSDVILANGRRFSGRSS